MITGLDHATIYTDDIEATRRFYVDVLGLEVGFRPTVSVPGYWLYSGPNPILHLVAGETAREARGAIDHVSFAVQDFDAVLARLTAAGVAFRAFDIPNDLGRQAFVSDPNGVNIELTWRKARVEAGVAA